MKVDTLIDTFIYHNFDFDIKVKLITKDYAVSKVIFTDSYERETISFLKRIILPEDIIYDIGANIGYYSLIFSRLVGPKGWVHSFEPSEREFLLLAENVNLNSFNNVYLNQLAISEFSGIIEMSISEKPAYGAYNTIGVPTHGSVEKEIFRKETIRTTTLDDYSSVYNVQKPSIIKIDVEGGELNVLKGGRNLFSREDSPILVLEICEATLKGFGIVPNQVLNLLKEYSYNLFSIRSDGLLVPFGEGISLNIVGIKKHSLQLFEQLGVVINSRNI
ncbi:MAG: FkbM family methyltransferase [Anaerolineales bacterium]